MFEKIKCFILDMDGTIYLGNELFSFTKDFLKKVEETERKYYYPGEYLVPIAKEFVKANPDCAKELTKDLTQENLETLSSFAKARMLELKK